MVHAADTNLSGTLCNGRPAGDRANAESQKLSHGFAQFVILESESESESVSPSSRGRSGSETEPEEPHFWQCVCAGVAGEQFY